ncbi:MAG: CCA tRNA nucleotidyltransferase [Dehalococcoidia bacterium]
MRSPLDVIAGKLDSENQSLLRLLRQRSVREGLPVYLVGGPVRDLLLDAPIKDLDFVIEGEAPALAAQLAQEAGGEVVVHSRFGTATVVLGGARVDVVTARREVYPQPGALPEVTPGSIADDLARRDFSINAMALPLQEGHPPVLDPQGGGDDLEQGIIRTLHPNSFVDDPTRIWRAVRYEQRLGFKLESETARQLRQALDSGCLASVSPDRVRHELERILGEWVPYPALARTAELGILAALHPALGQGDDLSKLATGLGQMPDPDPLVYWAALAYPLSAGEGESLIHRLNALSTWAEVIRDTVELRNREPKLAVASLAPSRIYRLLEGLSLTASRGVSLITDSEPVRQRIGRFLESLRFVNPQLNGSDLLEMGVPAGPRMGQLLRRLKDARLDGEVTTEAEERDLVRQSITSEGGR